MLSEEALNSIEPVQPIGESKGCFRLWLTFVFGERRKHG
jgi:hypothetical protein